MWRHIGCINLYSKWSVLCSVEMVYIWNKQNIFGLCAHVSSHTCTLHAHVWDIKQRENTRKRKKGERRTLVSTIIQRGNEHEDRLEHNAVGSFPSSVNGCHQISMDTDRWTDFSCLDSLWLVVGTSSISSMSQASAASCE